MWNWNRQNGIDLIMTNITYNKGFPWIHKSNFFKSYMINYIPKMDQSKTELKTSLNSLIIFVSYQNISKLN